MLAPGVQHHDRTDLSTEVSLVGRDRLQSLNCRVEQHGVNNRLVVIGDRRYRHRQREHHMEVLDRQQVGSAGGEPLAGCRTLALRAMTIATGNGGRPLPVLWANPVMGSWRRVDRILAAVATNPLTITKRA